MKHVTVEGVDLKIPFGHAEDGTGLLFVEVAYPGSCPAMIFRDCGVAGGQCRVTLNCACYCSGGDERFLVIGMVEIYVKKWFFVSRCCYCLLKSMSIGAQFAFLYIPSFIRPPLSHFSASSSCFARLPCASSKANLVV